MKPTDLNDLIQIDTVCLRRKVLAAFVQLEREMGDTVLNLRDDFVTGHLVAELRTSVFGRKLSEVCVSHPADWWQAVKDRWFPAWAKKKWPVKLATHRLVSTEEYLKVSCREHDHFVRLWKNPSPEQVFEGAL